MAQTCVQPAPATLLVGCGYVGQPLAAALQQRGMTVFGTTRSVQKASALATGGIRPLIADVTQPLTLTALKPAIESPLLDVIYLVPPGRPGREPSPRQIVIDGLNHVLKALTRATVRRAILISSSAVYGQSDGSRVDAGTPAQPIDERGKLLKAGEDRWLNAGDNFHVLRLAGIYGPHRVIGLKAVREGAPLVGNPDAWLNLIHVDDVVQLILAMLTAPQPGRIELGADGRPATRQRYYKYLARLLDVAPPPVLDDATAAAQLGLNVQRLRRASSKMLDPTPTCDRTGWQPRYEDFRMGLKALLHTDR